MFTKKSHIDVKKSIAKIQDSKKDSSARLKHLKTILDHVDAEEAKSLFETNYSHVYYILYDTFVQAEANLKQRELSFHIVHKAHREELDGSLWLLGKILCLLPELLARRWQVHSLGRVLAKLLHHGNSTKLRKEGVKYFLLWYQSLGDNAPAFVDGMFMDLVPGLSVPPKNKTGPAPSTAEDFAPQDYLNHPNFKSETNSSVFHDTGLAHPAKSPEITPLLPPTTNERTAAPDPRDGLEILLDCMVQSSGCLRWRGDNNYQKYIRSFSFLLQRFREIYLPLFCPNYEYSTSIYEPKLDLPVIRTITKREEIMSSCVVVLINWLSKYTHDRNSAFNRLENNLQLDDIGSNEASGEQSSLLMNLRQIGYTQAQLVRDVLYSSRDTINFVHEMYRQAFLLGFTTKTQIEAMKVTIAVYRDWMSNGPPPFLLEPSTDETSSNPDISGSSTSIQRGQRLRTDSYLGAITKENLLIRAGLQNVLQIFITHAVNVFMIHTGHLNLQFQQLKSNVSTTPLDEQTDICKRVLNIYRTMVMKTRMEQRTWEQLLMVLLQITSSILQNSPPQAKKNNLGGRLAQPIFQTLIVTWIRAHTNVLVNPNLWDRFLKVLSTLTHREELIIEWDKTMQTLTRVLARQVYNLNLHELPLDRLAEQKGKRRRVGTTAWQQGGAPSGGSDSNSNINANNSNNSNSNNNNNHTNNNNNNANFDAPTTPSAIMKSEQNYDCSSIEDSRNLIRSVPGTPALNRSYSEGSLAPFRKSRGRRRIRNNSGSKQIHNIQRMFSNNSGQLSLSNDNLHNFSRLSSGGADTSTNIESASNLRRAISLDSIRRIKGCADNDSYRDGSRTPSPAASSGLDNGSIKDSPLQIDVMTGDSSSIDTQEDGNMSADRRSILSGGSARGWLPDVASVMWKRMLGALGDVNKILNPKLHAQVFKNLVNMTDSLIKIKMNLGISLENQAPPATTNYVPPIALVAPWCYGALALDSQFNQGKLYAMQLLCTIVKHGVSLGNDQLPLFYHALHQALTGEDRAMAYTAIRFLGGPRFLSLLLPGHSLLLLDFVHASTVILTSMDTGPNTPRAEVAGLLGSLLCFPKTALPGPVLQPSEPHVDLMECPDLQEHVLNIVLRCARREPTAKARCIAISALGQWIIQNLTNPSNEASAFKQSVPHYSNINSTDSTTINPRITEAFQVILQALQFKNRTIARIAAETLKLCAEKGKEIARIERLPQLIINALCVSLELQNISSPKESDKTVLTSLLLCLGEFCMSLPIKMLLYSRGLENTKDENLILTVFKILHRIATGTQYDRIKLFTTDEDFDMTILMDDVREQIMMSAQPSYQTSETTQACIQTIRLCAKTVAIHLVTNLAHFPIGIGTSRLSSLVDEQDDLSLNSLQRENSVNSNSNNRDSIDLSLSNILCAPNIQLFMLSQELVSSFIELPALKLPGGGITAGLITANRQVRILLRDLNGKSCWDASILYREPNDQNAEQSANKKQPVDASSFSVEKQQFFAEKSITTSTTTNRNFQYGRNFVFNHNNATTDHMISTVGLPTIPLRHTLRHRPPNQLPLAKDLASDLDQLDDLLQYIGHSSPECLNANEINLNSAGPSPLGGQLEAQTISIILNQRALEAEYVARQSVHHTDYFNVDFTGIASNATSSTGFNSFIDESLVAGGSIGPKLSMGCDGDRSYEHRNRELLPFQYCRLLFSQLGFTGWERRKRTQLLNRTDKLFRELRNLDAQKCRETHKMAVIYVANGQEDKNSILRNACGSSTYEMFVSALGWEIELESHNGFLGGLPRQGCGSTAPYYATPFMEVIYHVATRMPCDSAEAILNKTRHLGNDEVHIVWSENNRDYRRDILPTEFCDVLITIYPLKSGLFRVTVNKKPDVPWFGPLSDESVVGGSCLASLVRASAINASRAKRTSLPFYQQYYEERNRSLEAVASRHKESSTYEDFAARVFSPIPSNTTVTTANAGASGAPLAAALIDHHHRSSIKSWIQHPEVTVREIGTQHSAASSLDHPSPRPLRKLHPFKSVQKKSSTPPDSPTLPARKFK